MGEDKELIRRGGDDTVDAAGGHGRGEPRGEAGGQTRLPQKNRGAPWKGEGRSNRCGWSAAGRGPPSSSILAGTPREGGGGYISAGGKPPDCVEALRAAVALSLSPNVSALTSLSRDVLCLL